MSKVKRKHWRMEVEWEDSTVLPGGWRQIRDILSTAQRSVIRCWSVGFVLADDDDGIVLASSVHGTEAVGVTLIPRSAIRRRRKL